MMSANSYSIISSSWLQIGSRARDYANINNGWNSFSLRTVNSRLPRFSSGAFLQYENRKFEQGKRLGAVILSSPNLEKTRVRFSFSFLVYKIDEQTSITRLLHNNT